ncbi:MAG: purine-nucleoside phosphorylase [Kiritimatiellia bacterium]
MKDNVPDKAFREVRRMFGETSPRLAVVLGSGWEKAAEFLTTEKALPYEDIPGLGAAKIPGHRGTLALAGYDGLQMLVFHGRRHFYEGDGWLPAALPIHIACRFEISSLLLTNSAGGIRPDLQPGELMIIDDHINLMGANPLMEPGFPRKETFPDQTQVYSNDLNNAMELTGNPSRKPVKHGVYASVTGPAYETPAEVQALARMGADAVGMSTVPEAILANAAGIQTAAVSLISNCAARSGRSPLSHADALAVSESSTPVMKRLLEAFINHFSKNAE